MSMLRAAGRVAVATACLLSGAVFVRVGADSGSALLYGASWLLLVACVVCATYQLTRR